MCSAQLLNVSIVNDFCISICPVILQLGVVCSQSVGDNKFMLQQLYRLGSLQPAELTALYVQLCVVYCNAVLSMDIVSYYLSAQLRV